jgi:hypothetical protein
MKNKHNALNVFADALLLRTDRFAYAQKCTTKAAEEMALTRKNTPPTHDSDSIRTLYPDADELAYQKRRRNEFLETLADLLHHRLQPGFAKYNVEPMHVGQCPFPMFDHWFGYINIGTIRKRKVFADHVDGVKKPRRKFYYDFDGKLPGLNTKYKYYKRNHGQLNGQSPTDLHSEYSKLSFIIDEKTGIVTCKYEQKSFETASNMLIP